MPGMRQLGATQVIALSALQLAGTIPQGGSVTLDVVCPLAKAGDVPALSIALLPEGAGVGALLQEWYCTDGMLHLTFASAQEGNFDIASALTVGLLRSPGFPGQVTPIGRSGLPPNGDTPTPVAGPGAPIPLAPFNAVNDALGAPIAAGASGIIAFQLWGGASPPGQAALMATALCHLTLGADVMLTGWQTTSPTTLVVGVFNNGVGDYNPGAGTLTARGVMVLGRASPNTVRSAVAGVGTTGVVNRRHLRALWPQSNTAVPGTFIMSPASPAGQSLPDAQTPTGRRLWLTSQKGLAGTDVGWRGLPAHAGGGGFTAVLAALGTTPTINAASLESYAHPYDVSPAGP